jgi:hypothetical protein
LSDIAEMNADAKLYATLGRESGVAFHHAVLHFDRTAHCIDYAAEFGDDAVAGALHNAAVMRRNSRIDQVAKQGSEPR